MPNKNIQFKSKQISEFFSAHRQKWEELYPSERWVLNRVAGQDRMLGDVLDVGCACGGLSRALSEKFVLNSYTGVDINKDAIDWAHKFQKLSIPTAFIAGDVLEQRLDKRYDLVVSLSCADWNIETEKVISYCWERVKAGGYFVISLRVTKKESVNDIKKSYQYINYSGNEDNPEIANYVVFNFKDAIAMVTRLNPSPQLVGAYGYWGTPSESAVTLFDKLVFCVFYIQKRLEHGNLTQEVKAEFTLPASLFQ